MNAKEKNIVEIDLNAIVAHLSDTIAFTGQILKELPPSDKASSVGAVIRSDIESLIDNCCRCAAAPTHLAARAK